MESLHSVAVLNPNSSSSLPAKTSWIAAPNITPGTRMLNFRQTVWQRWLLAAAPSTIRRRIAALIAGSIHIPRSNGAGHTRSIPFELGVRLCVISAQQPGIEEGIRGQLWAGGLLEAGTHQVSDESCKSYCEAAWYKGERPGFCSNILPNDAEALTACYPSGKVADWDDDALAECCA
jgi:hypothetical protein